MSRIRRWDGRKRQVVIACAALVAGLAHASSAKASAPHVVAPGETLWSISAANNLTTRTVAVFNGLSEDAQVVEGQTIQVPTVDEGAVALANAGITPGAPATDPAATALRRRPPPALAHGRLRRDAFVDRGCEQRHRRGPRGRERPRSRRDPGRGDDGLSIPPPSAVARRDGHDPVAVGRPAARAGGGRVLERDARRLALELRRRPLSGRARLGVPHDRAAAGALRPLPLGSGRARRTRPAPARTRPGAAVDVAEPVMRDVIDQIGAAYGWVGTIPSEWWHVQHGP